MHAPLLCDFLTSDLEVTRAKEKLVVELAAANVRNDERHNHVSMYEKALKASQAQVASLDEEVRPAIGFIALLHSRNLLCM